MIDRHGEGVVEILESTRNYPAGFTRDGLRLKIQEYKKKLSELHNP